MAKSIWIAELRISDRTAEKLRSKHGLDPEEVRMALIGVPGLTYTWHQHQQRGLRAIVETTLGTQRVLAVLYPVDSPLGGVWNLGSAYRV